MTAKLSLVEGERPDGERSEVLLRAMRQALDSEAERRMAAAYARAPDSAADVALDPAAWDPRPKRGRRSR
jgi:hypothetical protein